MTTYPLSEPATLHRGAGVGDTRGEPGKAVTHGTLADCAEILAGWAAGERANARIDMDDMSLRYGPDEIEELLQFLRNEAADQPAESRRSGD